MRLFAGRPPFKVLTTDPIEIARLICDRPPTRPSAATNEENSLSAPDRRRLRGDLDNIGLARFLAHDLPGSEAKLREAVAIREHSFPAAHPQIIAAQARLGDVLVSEGKTSDAELLLRAASASAHHSPFPFLPWQVAEADNALGICLARMGHVNEAVHLLRSSLEPLKKHPQATIRKLDLQRTTAILRK